MPQTEWGTSQDPEVIRARARTRIDERFQWLAQAWLLADATGALAQDRATRARLALAWNEADTWPPTR